MRQVSLLRLDPAQRGRLEEIRDNLHDRIAEAEREGWLARSRASRSAPPHPGELAQIHTALQCREQAVHLGMPVFPDIAAVCPAKPRKEACDHCESPPSRRRCAPRARHIPLKPAPACSSSAATGDREDFTSRSITAGTSISDGITLLASTDWEAAVTALHAGELLASGGNGACSF